MTVKQLIKILQTIKDKDSDICISIDEEGNDFVPIYEVCKASGELTATGDKVKGYIIYPN